MPTEKMYWIRFWRLEFDVDEQMWLTADESEVALIEAFDQQDAIRRLRAERRVASLDSIFQI